MAKKSRMSVLKRQREVKKAEKAARKRAKRHGLPVQSTSEPMPSAGVVRLLNLGSSDDDDSSESPAKSAE